jgi:glycosyltransferase involved in cell wall biosynthesis
VDEKQKKELANYNSIGISNICDGNRLVEYYSAADVFINPTLEDNFPTVNIEALACGTPCVTFDTGGAGEIIDQKTGVLIEKKEWKKMINAATSIDKKAMSDDCVARVKHLYDEKLMAEQYIEIYRKMVE